MTGQSSLWQAAGELARGQVVAVATGSSYALCARVHDGQAIDRVRQLKSEARHAPIATIAGHWSQLRQLVRDVPAWVVYNHRYFWPGPLTILLPALPTLAPALVGADGTVGVRLAETGWLGQLAQMVGPLTATSANPTGQPAAQSKTQMAAYYPGLPCYGSCGGQPPSTIVDARSVPPRVLRQGAAAFDPHWLSVPGVSAHA